MGGHAGGSRWCRARRRSNRADTFGLLRWRSPSLTHISERQNRSGILHGAGCAACEGFGEAAWIGGDVDGLAVGAHRSVAIAVFRLEVTPEMAAGRLSIGGQRQHVKRAALQRGHQEDFIPTRNAFAFRLVVFDAGSAHRRPADEVDSLAGRVLKVISRWHREHRRDRFHERLIERRLWRARY